jgi:hypothetical protein
MLNLVVVLYGYYKDEYWLIRGPFGDGWGYMGAMKVAMGSNCGLNERVGFITFNAVEKQINQ